MCYVCVALVEGCKAGFSHIISAGVIEFKRVGGGLGSVHGTLFTWASKLLPHWLLIKKCITNSLFIYLLLHTSPLCQQSLAVVDFGFCDFPTPRSPHGMDTRKD